MMILDDRIGAIDLHPYLRTPHDSTRLEFGDIAIIGTWSGSDITIGLERKRIHDLLSSVDSGRLVAHQIPGLLDDYDRQYLIVEGVWKFDENRYASTYRGKRLRPIHHGKQKYNSRRIHSSLVSIEEHFGIRIVYTRDEAHTAAFADDVHYWYNKKKHKMPEIMRSAPIPVSINTPPPIALMVKELTGVGGRKALDLAVIFPTMEDLMKASINDITQVPGIGPTIAEGIWRQLRGKS